MSVTIDQIAERAGVSSSTVARVLRGDVKGVQRRSARNAQKILRISEELGYRPNWRGRALSSGKTQTIGLLYCNAKWIFEDPMSDLATSFTEALQEQNYDLRLIPVTSSSNWKELVYGSAVDGLAFLANVPEAAKEVVGEGRLPTIMLCDKFGNVPHVVPDDEAGGYLATRHLLALGHRHITFHIDESIRLHYSIEERQAGYRRAMDEAGLGEHVSVLHGKTEELVDRLHKADPPTAMVGYCHIEAMRVMHAAWSHGMSVPTDLSIVAFNDIAMTECLTPALTVMGFDTREMGRAGAEMLISRINSPDDPPPSDVVVPLRLVVRGTTARRSARASSDQ
ncbi:MAG: LacI family DNA-binding transcriptional regulator [Planctomycetota bacterium]